MKKYVYASGLVLALSLVIVRPTAAHAEISTDGKTATNEATFTLNAETTGTLKITDATDLTFTSKNITASDVVTSTTGESSISIQELSGAAPGWSVTATLGEFTDTTVSTKKLVGAQIFYPAGEATTTAAASTPAASALPTFLGTETAFEGTTTGISVNAGGSAVKIIEAAKGKGYGNWKMSYSGDNKVQLKVPQGQLKGSYKATLTYTLQDAPVTS